MDQANTKKSSNDSFMIASTAAFVLIAIGIIVFLYNQNQTLKKELSSFQTSIVATTTPSSTPDTNNPIVTSPTANSKVKSPLKVTGKVPADWMFEGVFPIKLLDSDKNVIAESQGKEIIDGAWQSENSVDFSATLTFKNATGEGTLVLENDNSSGNVATLKSFEVPITF